MGPLETRLQEVVLKREVGRGLNNNEGLTRSKTFEKASRTKSNILNYCVKSSDACKPYLYDKLNCVPLGPLAGMHANSS
jgi:hypothetical protein